MASPDVHGNQSDADIDAFDIGPGGDPRNPELNPESRRAPDGGSPPSPDVERRVSASDAAQDDPEPDEATIRALGTLSEAVEWIERARGRLYDFHQMTGHADELLGRAADELEAAGHPMWAAEIKTELVGRNVIAGRWTFQVVDEYDDLYWGPVRATHDRVEHVLAGGRRHLHEAQLKERRRSRGRRHHEAAPADTNSSPDAVPPAG